MKLEDLKRHKLPDTPGVYYFLDKNKKILYIGKATSLKSRVRSYFASDIIEKRSPLIKKMVDESSLIDYTETDSVLEALILETNLIQSHKPTYNTKSKDDKSYNHLIITNEEWPRVLVVRSRDITEKFLKEDIKYDFGPFTSPTMLRESLKIVRKLFRFYDTKKSVSEIKSKFSKGIIDFNRQINLYPSEENKEQYQNTIRHLRLFFQGKKQKVVEELNKKMIKAARAELFEEANQIKKQIFALKHIEDISLIKNEKRDELDSTLFRVEAYDVAHHVGSDMVGVMVVVVGSEPRKEEYRKFKLKTVKQANDPAALKEVLERRFKHLEWPLPALIVVDGNEVQRNVAETVIRSNNLSIPVAAVVKDDRHKASRILAPKNIEDLYKFDILLSNSEAHRFAINYYRKLAIKRIRN